MNRALHRLVFMACAAIASSVAAQELRLLKPVDCELGKNCYIQNYVDSDPYEGAADFRCNALTYNDHTGTDFGLPYRKDIARDVSVLAAAEGTVRGLRDGEIDGLFLQAPEEVARRECGNGIVLDHGEGWHTQYCHLKQGSVAVKEGERVAAGQMIGLIGMSGKAAFPHVHFSVRYAGRTIDPFNPNGTRDCALKERATMWAEPISYQAGGLLGAGFASQVPGFEEVKTGGAGAQILAKDAPALVLWAYFFGSRLGDVVEMKIKGPEGFTFEHRTLIRKAQALAYRAAGKRRKTKAWPAGSYEGHLRLVRQGNVISEMQTALQILH